MVIEITVFIVSCLVLSWLSSKFIKTLTEVAKYLRWREFVIAFFVPALMLGGVSATAYAINCYQDTSINKTGDWFATLGKKGRAKERILLKRKHDRITACARKNLESLSRRKIS